MPEPTFAGMTALITLGKGRNKPAGRGLQVGDIDELARLLQGHQGVDAWWSGAAFEGDYRDGNRWRGSSVLGADFDYHDADGEHAPMPPGFRAKVEAVLPELRTSLAHATHRGLRAIALLDRLVDDEPTFKLVSEAHCARVANTLAVAGLLGDRNGLRLDTGASMDRARFWFTPRATVDGVERTAEVVRTGGIVPLAELTAERPGSSRKGSRAPQTPAATPADRTDRRASRYAAGALSSAVSRVAGAANGTRNNTLNDQAFAIAQLAAGGVVDEQLAREALHDAAAQAGLEEGEICRTLDSAFGAGARSPRGLPDDYDQAERDAIADEAAPQFFKCTDSGNAERFAAAHRGRVLHCAAQRAWMIWDGARFARDERGAVQALAKNVVRGISAEASRIQDDEVRKAVVAWAHKSESRSKREALIALAECEQGLAVVPGELDADPMLLNAPNGTIDLRTGALRPHQRADRLTKCTAAPFVAGTRSELLERVLLEAMGGDAELVAFFQRAAGYSCTGRTDEEKLFMPTGPAATGKSTLINAVQRVLGDYARTADFEAFLAQKNGGGPRNDIARLAGARFVCSIEVDKGKRLAQGLVKTVTGGDTVTARFLYAEAFEFRPEFKLWLVANDAPRVQHDDSGLWRRILRIPFEHVVPAAQRDPSVKAQLIDPAVSGPALLAWLVEGCLAWQRDGLRVPKRVLEATEQYRESQDAIGAFVRECCSLLWGATVSRKALRTAFEDWSGPKCASAADFNEAVRKLEGVGEKTVKGVRFWTGIALAEGT